MLKIGSKGLGLILACVLAGVLLVGCNNEPSSEKEGEAQAAPAAPAGMIGLPAPDFTLTDMQGQQVSLSQFRGKIVILNFWATWCPPCVEEMPSMEQLYREFKDKDLVVLAVNVESSGQEAVSEFLAKKSYSFKILLDPDAEIQNTYGVFRLPESFLIDRNGVVVEKVIGGRNWRLGDLYEKISFLLQG